MITSDAIVIRTANDSDATALRARESCTHPVTSARQCWPPRQRSQGLPFANRMRFVHHGL